MNSTQPGDGMNSPTYRHQKLCSAIATLMTHEGNLRERVREAGKYWAFVYDFEPFEPEATQIRTALAPLQHGGEPGDYSRLSDKQLSQTAQALYELAMRVLQEKKS